MFSKYKKGIATFILVVGVSFVILSAGFGYYLFQEKSTEHTDLLLVPEVQIESEGKSTTESQETQDKKETILKQEPPTNSSEEKKCNTTTTPCLVVRSVYPLGVAFEYASLGPNANVRMVDEFGEDARVSLHYGMYEDRDFALISAVNNCVFPGTYRLQAHKIGSSELTIVTSEPFYFPGSPRQEFCKAVIASDSEKAKKILASYGPLPSCELSTNKTTYQPGEPVVYQWTTQDAETAAFDIPGSEPYLNLSFDLLPSSGSQLTYPEMLVYGDTYANMFVFNESGVGACQVYFDIRNH